MPVGGVRINVMAELSTKIIFDFNYATWKKTFGFSFSFLHFPIKARILHSIFHVALASFSATHASRIIF